MTPEELSRARVYDPDFDNPDPAYPPPPSRLTRGPTWCWYVGLAIWAVLIGTALTGVWR